MILSIIIIIILTFNVMVQNNIYDNFGHILKFT